MYTLSTAILCAVAASISVPVARAASVPAADPTDLLAAINFAIAKVSASGQMLDLDTRWGLNGIAAHTCSPIPDNYEVPTTQSATGLLQTVLNTGVLQLAALGPANWGSDGNYLVTPPVGFWPSYVEAVVGVLNTQYSLRIMVNRTFYQSSAQVLASLENGQAHLSEPYFALGGFYNGRPRSVAFESSCTVLGYDSTFFVNSTTAAASSITSVQTLATALEADPSRRVGVLSEGDWQSIQPVVPAGTQHTVFTAGGRSLDLAVQTGSVYAGMVSGAPNTTLGFATFSSTIVTPRAFLLPPVPVAEPCTPGDANGASAVTAPASVMLLALTLAAFASFSHRS